MASSLGLLRRRRFLPLFVTQALGAVNDNLFKNALVVLVLFRIAAGAAGGSGGVLVPLSGGVFILPYALFSATAGQLADRYEKARLIRATKCGEVALMLLAAAGFLSGSLVLLMLVLFGLGVQATFFGPLKYGILPTHLAEDELVSGNGLIEAGTFLGILAGTIAGGALILLPDGPMVVSGAGLAVASAGLAAAFAIPPAPSVAPELRIGWNLWRETASLIRHSRQNRPVWLCTLGISWFWVVGATVLAEFPVLARDTIGADGHVVTLMLAAFSLGIGIGSVVCARLLHGEITARFVPFAAAGISVFLWDFSAASLGAGGLPDVHAVLTSFHGLRILFDLVALALCGGIYSVPLYAMIQERSDPASRSRMIACNNVVNAAAMAVAAVIAAGLAAYGMIPPHILWLTALANLAVAAWIVRLLPNEVVRALFRWYFNTLHGVDLVGLAHVREAGPRSVVVVNHLSFFDGCFVAAFLPGAPLFAVNLQVATRWWARPFLAAVRNFPVDPANPFATRAMIHAVRGGETLVIFPEGRITTTGALMKVYEGAGMVADRAEAALLPVRIDGLQFTPLSRLRGKLRQRWFPRLSLTVLPPVHLSLDPGLAGRKRRQAVGTILQSLMERSDFATSPTDRPLFRALRDASARFGAGTPIAEDIARTPLTYRTLQLGALVLGRALRNLTGHVGLLLPNSNAAVVSFFALQAQGIAPAMLNASAGADAVLGACRAAGVRQVICARQFVQKGKLERLIARMEEAGIEFIWLEQLRGQIGRAARLRGLVDHLFARAPGLHTAPDAPACVLFTSGSEGRPKGVVLSHRNLLANCAQLASVIDFNSADRVFNAMPMFHAFGLTGGTLLPLLYGVRSFFYPSPLHYRIVPQLIYDTDATICFGTDTFLTGWARFAHPYDFYAMRYIFAGAERVRPETRTLYAERFGVRVLEGYGATETAPVIALNTPMHARAGSAGRMLPGITWRTERIEGIDRGGRLFVHGPNIMLGYYRAEAPGDLQPPEGGWYDTGDIVDIDAGDFVTILGRAKRFAKIGGEMVSMAAAEILAGKLWPDAAHAVISQPDPRKGEQLVLVTTQPDAAVPALLAHARAQGVAELMVPRAIRVIEQLPLLATGKVDYPILAAWALAA
jgi:acyl-[acyl-carrier-protein]-phospholipid O-acyltransferase/long-chain-fatty-acid--[acyl-carrier-protein] ligase